MIIIWPEEGYFNPNIVFNNSFILSDSGFAQILLRNPKFLS